MSKRRCTVLVAVLALTLHGTTAEIQAAVEITWDDVADMFAAPNNLPADYFNTISPRGVVFSTPGSGFQVSADSSNPTSTPVEFGNIDPSYPSFFATFSPERLFTPLGSNIVDVNFFVPGTTIPALTNEFGAIFTDVDLPATTSLEFFDASNVSLGKFFVMNSPIPNESLSSLMIDFSDPVISRVRIVSGNQVLAPGNTDDQQNDLVAMDNFIYGDLVAAPIGAVPEYSSLTIFAVLGLCFAAGAWWKSRNHQQKAVGF